MTTGLTLNETDASSDPLLQHKNVFLRKKLRRQLAERQAERQTITVSRFPVRKIAKRDTVRLKKHPPLLCRAYCDPDVIGTDKRKGFNAHGKLIRPPIQYRMQPRCAGVSRLRHLAFAMTLPATAMPLGDPRQLRSSLHWERLCRLADLYVARLRNLRRQSCMMFRTVEQYAQALYCPPSGTYSPYLEHRVTGVRTQSFAHCGLRRMCPFCWTQAYVVEPFFRLRAVLARAGSIETGKNFVPRKDCRLVCVRQTWSYPYDTHPFEMLADLQSRKAQLYRETPSARGKLIAMVQLHYIEPPVRANTPWLLQRRAVLVCHESMPQFGYPDDSYDVCNQSYSQTPTLKHLTTQLARNFNYPAALLLADAARVRQLLDAYMLWPHGTRYGFELYTSRGKIDQIHKAYRQKVRQYAQDQDFDDEEDC